MEAIKKTSAVRKIFIPTMGGSEALQAVVNFT